MVGLAYRRYSRAYVDEEASARSTRRGLWRGDFVAPWDWRQGERLGGDRDAERSGLRQQRWQWQLPYQGQRLALRQAHLPCAPGASTTSARASVPRRTSAGFAASPRPALRAGGRRSGDGLQGQSKVSCSAVAPLWAFCSRIGAAAHACGVKGVVSWRLESARRISMVSCEVSCMPVDRDGLGPFLEALLAGSRSRASWNDRFAHWERPASGSEEGADSARPGYGPRGARPQHLANAGGCGGQAAGQLPQ